jgi:hypothetical protein
MVKIVKFKDNSLAIGNNDDDLKDYVKELVMEHGSITKQYIVCKDEVDAFIKSLMKAGDSVVKPSTAAA